MRHRWRRRSPDQAMLLLRADQVPVIGASPEGGETVNPLIGFVVVQDAANRRFSERAGARYCCGDTPIEDGDRLVRRYRTFENARSGVGAGNVSARVQHKRNRASPGDVSRFASVGAGGSREAGWMFVRRV